MNDDGLLSSKEYLEITTELLKLKGLKREIQLITYEELHLANNLSFHQLLSSADKTGELKTLLLSWPPFNRIIKEIVETKIEFKEHSLRTIEKRYLPIYPNLYLNLKMAKKNKELEPILNVREEEAARITEGWNWCKELCTKEPGLKSLYGDWESYYRVHFPQLKEYIHPYKVVKKTTPSIHEKKVSQKISQLKDEINLAIDKYDPTEYPRLKGAIGINREFKIKHQEERKRYLWIYLKNNLAIKFLQNELGLKENDDHPNADNKVEKFKDILERPELEQKFIDVLKGLVPEILDKEGRYIGGPKRKSVIGLWVLLLRSKIKTVIPNSKMVLILNEKFPNLKLGKKGSALDTNSDGKFSDKAERLRHDIRCKIKQIQIE